MASKAPDHRRVPENWNAVDIVEALLGYEPLPESRQNRYNPKGLHRARDGSLLDKWGRKMDVDWDEFEKRRIKHKDIGKPYPPAPAQKNPLHNSTTYDPKKQDSWKAESLVNAVLEGTEDIDWAPDPEDPDASMHLARGVEGEEECTLPFNPDAMALDEIDDLLQEIGYGVRPLRKANEWFPGKPGRVKAAKAVRAYLSNKRTAMRLREDGNIPTAVYYEEICQRIYDRLTSYARW